MAQRLIVKGSLFASQTTLALTIPAGNDTVAGRTLVASYAFSGGTTANLTSVTDSKGNSWSINSVKRSTSGTVNIYIAIVSCKLTTALVAGDTITFGQDTSTSYHLGAVYEFDNIAATGRLDVTSNGENTTGSTAVSTAATATTIQADEIVFAATMSGDSAASLTSDAPWTDLDEIQLVNTKTKTLRSAYQTVAATGQYAYSGTLSPAAVWVSALATFRVATSSSYLISAWTGAVDTAGATVAVKTAGATSVRLKVSTAPDLSGAVFSPAATPDANGNAKLVITGLTANTQYYYAVEVDSVMDIVYPGAFKTFPSGPSNFSFAFASCALSGSNSPVFDTIRTHTGLYGKPLMFCHLGDLHYDNISTNSQSSYRNSYDNVLSQSRQHQLYREIPTPYIWSDHDSGSNDHDGSDPGLLAAQPVYRQYVPHYPLSDSAGIYQSWVIGRVRFIATDLRSFKSADASTDDASKTMMGATQKAWFKARLSDPEPVKVWLNEIPWIEATTAGSDKWGGFNTERQEIASYVTSNNIKLLIIAGDMHALAADDGTNSAGGIPVCHAAPLSNATSFKGGPYTQSFYPNPVGATGHNFGWMDVTDAGNTITLAYSGYDDTNTSRIALTTVFTVGTSPGLTLTVSSKGYYYEALTLTAAGSDADGITSYAWTVTAAPAGSTATIVSPSSASTTITPDRPGSYTFQCVVTDGSGQSTTSSATVTVKPRVWVKAAGVAKPTKLKQRQAGASAPAKKWTQTSSGKQ